MRILKKILINFFVFFVKINFYYGSALVLSILTRPLNKRSKYRILSLNKSVFSNDLEEIKKVNSQLQFISFPRLLLSEIIKKYVHNFEDLNDASYHPIMDGTLEQVKIHKAMYPVFKHLKRMLKFDAIFAGNYVYVSQQEFFKIAKKENVPIIVLYKEGGIMAAVNKSRLINKNLYANKQFFGTKMLFYNSPIHFRLLEAKVPGIDESNSVVVGIPRLDRYLKPKENSKSKNVITLFAFNPQIKAVNFVSNKELVSDYIKIGDNFMIDIINFCIKNKEYKLNIKTKNDPKSINQIISLLKVLNIVDLPKNIEILNSGDPYKIIESSSIIASSLSTTLIEGLLMNKPILCPDFFTLGTKGFDDMFEDNKEIVNYVSNYEELSSMLKNSNFKKVKKENKDKALKPMIFNTDGKSSERVIEEIIKSIENS